MLTKCNRVSKRLTTSYCVYFFLQTSAFSKVAALNTMMKHGHGKSPKPDPIHTGLKVLLMIQFVHALTVKPKKPITLQEKSGALTDK